MEFLQWDMVTLYENFSSVLKDHVGFPTGNQLRDPAFEQNKARYLSAMPRHMVLPFHLVPIPIVDSNEVTSYIPGGDNQELLE
jgi:hypothetical protein